MDNTTVERGCNTCKNIDKDGQYPCNVCGDGDYVMWESDESPTSTDTAHTEELSTPLVREVKSAEEVLLNHLADYEVEFLGDKTGNITKAMKAYASQFTPHKEGYSVDGWVRVEDGLPELRVPVLVYMSYGKIDTCYWTGELWNQSVRPEHSNGSVTHWQPLPPPPNSLTN